MRIPFFLIIVFLYYNCSNSPKDVSETRTNDLVKYGLTGNPKKIINSSFNINRKNWMVHTIADVTKAKGEYDSIFDQTVNFDSLGFMDVDFLVNDSLKALTNDENIYYKKDSTGNWIEKITYVDDGGDENIHYYFIYSRIKRTIEYY